MTHHNTIGVSRTSPSAHSPFPHLHFGGSPFSQAIATKKLLGQRKRTTRRPGRPVGAGCSKRATRSRIGKRPNLATCRVSPSPSHTSWQETSSLFHSSSFWTSSYTWLPAVDYNRSENFHREDRRCRPGRKKFNVSFLPTSTCTSICSFNPSDITESLLHRYILMSQRRDKPRCHTR